MIDAATVLTFSSYDLVAQLSEQELDLIINAAPRALETHEEPDS